MIWGNSVVTNSFAATAIGSCLKAKIGVSGGPFDPLYYKGYNFTSMTGTAPFDKTCHDSNGNALDITQECHIYNDDGSLKYIIHGDKCPEECTTCNEKNGQISEISEGNQTLVPDLVKSEASTDWTSQKDSRFNVRRTYRSDSQLVQAFEVANVRDGFAGLWRFGYDEMIERGSTQGLDAGKYIYTNGAGRRFFFDQTTFAAGRLGHSITMSQSGVRLVVADGSGARKYFTEDAAGYFMLDEIAWSDGYAITFERGSDSRLLAFKDNRGQRAEALWTTTATANFTEPLIGGFRIDTGYNGSTFAPDVEVTYSYLQNQYVPERAAVERVTLTDLATTTSATQFAYRYGINRQTFPPKLLAVRDGRLNSGGQEFDFATFTYEFADYWAENVQRTEHAGGADRFDFAKLPDGRTQVLNPLGKATLYTFNGVGADRRLIGVEGAAGSGVLATDESWSHGTDKLFGEKLEKNGSRTTYARNSLGLVLTKTEDADGTSPRVTTYTWDTTLRKPLTRETQSLRETFTYDANGLVIGYSQTDILPSSPSLGQVRSWTYTYTALASGLKVLTSVNGPGDPATVNDVSTFTYNPDGTLATATDPNGLVTAFTAYSPLGQVTSMTAPDGIVWAFTYDVEGRITSTTRNPSSATPATWSFVYDAAGLLKQYSDSLGKAWTFDYDDARRLIRATNPSGVYVSYTYDAMGNITRTSEYASTGQEKFFETTAFDELGRIMKTGGVEPRRFSYDVEDNEIESRDAFGLARTQLHDALNRVVQAVDEDGSTELFEHNDDDQVTRYTDPRAIDTVTVFNGFGEVVSEASADRGTITYAYDLRGLVTSMTDGRGIVTTYEYDAGGRLIAKRFPSDSSLDQVFSYGATAGASRGKLVSVTEGSGSTGYTHDAASGLPATKTQTMGSATYTLGMTHDAEDRLTQLSYPSGAAVNYAYTLDGRISGITFASGEINPQTGQPYPPVSVVANAAYLPNGPLTSLTFGDGATLTETYNLSYQLAGQSDKIGSTTLRDLAYSWTARGNLGSVTDHLDPAKDQLFRYAPDQRLAEAGGAWGGLTYSYDAVGNRSTEAKGNWDGNNGSAGSSSPTAANNGDPYWNSVSYLAGFEQNYNDEGPAGFAPPVDPTILASLEVRPAAARIGLAGLAVNAENQSDGYMGYGPKTEIDFGTGDFTIEGFAKSNFNDNSAYHSILGNFRSDSTGSWSVFVTNSAQNRVYFETRGIVALTGTTNVGTGWFHFAVSRNGDVIRLFVNGVMRAQSTGMAGKAFGNAAREFVVGGNTVGIGDRWRGNIDELRVTKGIGRYSSSSSFPVPTAPYPRGAADLYWSKVTYLAGFEQNFADESLSALVPTATPGTQPVLIRSTQATKIGAFGLAVNPYNQYQGKINYGPRNEVNFGVGDFTIEGFAKVNYYDATWWRSLLGNYYTYSGGQDSWSVYALPSRKIRFAVAGQNPINSTSDLGTNWFHFAVSRNGDVIRLFVNGIMEAKSTGWTGKNIGNSVKNFLVGGDNLLQEQSWRGYIDEVRITKGVGRYFSDASFTVPAAPYPREILKIPSTAYTQAISQHIPLASSSGVTTETATMNLGADDANRHVLLNIAWAGASPAEITSVTVDGTPATRIHRMNGAATSNVELWAIAKPTGATAAVSVTWSAAVAHRHITLYTAPLSSLATASVGSAIPNGSGGYAMAGVTIPPGAIVIGGTLGSAFVQNEPALFGPGEVFHWDAKDQRSATGTTQLQSHTFSTQNPTAAALSYDTSGPVPYYVVTFDPGSFLDPATVTTDGYSYGSADNRLAQVAEAGGHTRAFTYDASGNVIYDNRSGGGYGYAYDAAGRMATFSINGVVQANYRYNAEGQQVVRELTQTGEIIHAVHDMEGNRIAEYLYDDTTGASTLIRQYIWMEGRAVAVVEGGQIFFIRTDHIGRPVFATNDLGAKVWEASYLPFGGVHVATGGIALRFPGQWFQAESGLHQNWMRDYDPTTGRYIEADPLGLVDGASVYGYVRGNPGRYIDPRGEFVGPYGDESPIEVLDPINGAGNSFGGGGGGGWTLGPSTAAAIATMLGLGSDTPTAFPTPNEEEESCRDCWDIYEQIDRAIADMRRRFLHMAKNRLDQPFEHAAEILARQRGLRNMIEEAKSRRCIWFDKRAYYYAWAPVPGPGYLMPAHIR